MEFPSKTQVQVRPYLLSSYWPNTLLNKCGPSFPCEHRHLTNLLEDTSLTNFSLYQPQVYSPAPAENWAWQKAQIAQCMVMLWGPAVRTAELQHAFWHGGMSEPTLTHIRQCDKGEATSKTVNCCTFIEKSVPRQKQGMQLSTQQFPHQRTAIFSPATSLLLGL